jgi:hypothetical protein
VLELRRGAVLEHGVATGLLRQVSDGADVRGMRACVVTALHGSEVYMRLHYHVEDGATVNARPWSACAMYWPDRGVWLTGRFAGVHRLHADGSVT